MKNGFLWLILACLLPNWLMAADATATLSQHLLDLSGRKAGICSMPRCGDGKLVVEIAQNSKLLVYALSDNPAEVVAARKAADDAGFLGRTVYVEEGSVAKNPLGDWCADLLVIDDAADASLDQIAPKEVRRVLSPYRGVAIVGRSKSLGAGLTRARLEAWLKSLDVPGGKIVEDDFGLWAVATMPPLMGGDDWTHYAHDADQNRYSNDYALKWPYLIQWTAKPYYDGKFDIAVAAGGRLFRANVTLAVDNTKPTDGIIARSAYNGNVLWTRKTADDFGTFGSLIVATPNVVYVKDGNGVLCLDAETGTELKRFALSNNPQTECRWLMLQDGVLVTVLGSRPNAKSLRDLPEALTKDSKLGMNSGEEFAVQQNWFQNYDQGKEIVAIDVASSKELWRVPASGIDPAKMAITSDRVFFFAERSYASCLDLKTGNTIWKTDAPIAKNPAGTGWSFTFMITERVGALASADVYLINSYKDGHYQAFSAKDGSILWGQGRGREKQKPQDEGKLGKQSYPIMLDGKIFTKDEVFLDPLTGKPAGQKLPALNWGTCGSFCVTPHGIHGGGGTAYDRDTTTRIDVQGGYMKAACLSGVIAADGTLFSGHGNCSGCMEWIGHLAFCSAHGFSLTDAASTADRLLTGKSMDTPGIEATPLDWTTYRADNVRSGASSATVPAKGKIAWTWTPNPPFDYAVEAGEGLETQSTQPICVGDRVIFGTAAGIIRCLDRKTGTELWCYPTAGRIISSPTFWEGKVYAGSGDGRVYCLNAEDGSLVWRYRVAPVERRIMVYGHLMSSWPINANVMVQPSTNAGQTGAVAYASAGLVGTIGGSVLCALDARTGKLCWETRFSEPNTDVLAKPRFTREGEGQNFRLEPQIDASGRGCAPETVYHAMRMGSAITYTFHELKPQAPYIVRLHFVEPWEKSAGKRVMDVTVNGQPGLTKFDIFAEAGGQNKAIARQFAASADQDGNVAIRLTHSAGTSNNVVISGIELLDGQTPVCKVQTGGKGVGQADFMPDCDPQFQPTPPPIPSATGQMAWYDGKLWLHVGDSGVLIVDPSTGKTTQAIDFGKLDNLGGSLGADHMRAATCGSSRGQDIGILPGGWVVLGGRQFYLPKNMDNQPRGTSSFVRAKPDVVPMEANGYPDVVVIPKTQGSGDIPVWDAKETLLLGARNQHPVLCTGLGEFLAASLAAHPFDPVAAHKGYWNSGVVNTINSDFPADQERTVMPSNMKSTAACSPLLAANAVISLVNWGPGWHVMAANRADANLLWNISLPAQPLFGGLSLTRTGDVLVPLVDGRVVCVGAL